MCYSCGTLSYPTTIIIKTIYSFIQPLFINPTVTIYLPSVISPFYTPKRD